MKLIHLFLICISIGFCFESTAMLRGMLRKTSLSGSQAIGTRLIMRPSLSCVQKTSSLGTWAKQNENSHGSNKQCKRTEYVKYAAGVIGAAVILSKTKNTAAATHDLDTLAAKRARKRILKEIGVYKAPFESQRQKFREQLLNAQWKEVSREYIDSLDVEAKQLREEFFTLTKISEDEYNVCKCMYFNKFGFMKEIEDRFATKYAVLQGPYLERTTALLKLLSFDTTNIIFLVADDNGSPLAAAQKQLIVNPYLCAKFKNINAFDAAVFHECVHMMEDDTFEMVVQAVLCELHCADEEAAKKYHIKKSLFNEKRADILAGLINPELTLALAEDFHRSSNPPWIKRISDVALYGRFIPYDKTSLRHPKNSERAVYLKELHEKMVAAMKKTQKQDKT